MAFPMPSNGAPPAIETFGLAKRYVLGEHQSLRHTIGHLRRTSDVERPVLEALTDVSVTVHRGESLGIVGSNGSGKSTLLQVISGITLPTSGHAVVRGRVLPLLAVGTGFHPELTGRENVSLFAASLGLGRLATPGRMEQIAHFAGLERHMDTPSKRFSSGMLARLSFAVAVLFPADIYLFDEVMATVDGEFQARCMTEIKALSDSGRTVIFISHHLEPIADLCDRVLWLDQGRVRQIGEAADVLPAYRSATDEAAAEETQAVNQ